MKVKEELVVTSMSLDGYKLCIPEGFSDLMNRSGAWEYITPDGKTKNEDPSENYTREVVKEAGRLRTYLRYKNSSSKRKIS